MNSSANKPIFVTIRVISGYSPPCLCVAVVSFLLCLGSYIFISCVCRQDARASGGGRLIAGNFVVVTEVTVRIAHLRTD